MELQMKNLRQGISNHNFIKILSDKEWYKVTSDITKVKKTINKTLYSISIHFRINLKLKHKINI